MAGVGEGTAAVVAWEPARRRRLLPVGQRVVAEPRNRGRRPRCAGGTPGWVPSGLGAQPAGLFLVVIGWWARGGGGRLRGKSFHFGLTACPWLTVFKSLLKAQLRKEKPLG